MTMITAKKLQHTLYDEGFHILVYSDSQVRRMSGLSSNYCREKKLIKGLVLPDKNEIIVNRSLSTKERVLTLIHELIHLAKPKLSERQTESEAHNLYNRMNDRDLGFFEFAVSHSS